MAKRPTSAELRRYNELLAEQKQLRRRAADLNAEIEPLEEAFAEHVRAAGGKSKLVVTCGHLLRLNAKPGSVAWKREFIREAGKEAAEALIASQPTKEVLTVEAAA